jgi:preprotein translocase subunit YajC
MFWGVAFAMAPPPGAQPGPLDAIMSFAPLIILVFIFYIFLFRPQQKKRAETDNMIKGLKEGDNVMTTGGIYGTVTKVKEDTLTVQIAENVKIKLNRSYVSSLK